MKKKQKGSLLDTVILYLPSVALLGYGVLHMSVEMILVGVVALSLSRQLQVLKCKLDDCCWY